MTHRRDFLRLLALGTGAILIGRGWYKPGQGLIVPPDYGLAQPWSVVWSHPPEIWIGQGVVDDMLAQAGLQRTSPEAGVYQLVGEHFVPPVMTMARVDYRGWSGLVEA